MRFRQLDQICREDLPDFIYKDQLSKWNAIAKECKNISEFWPTNS